MRWANGAVGERSEFRVRHCCAAARRVVGAGGGGGAGAVVVLQAAKVAGIEGSVAQGTESVSAVAPLSQCGLDSLTAVEMKNEAELAVHVDAPVVDFARDCQQSSLRG
jgi:hypothetical protein